MGILNELQMNSLVKEMCDVLEHYEWHYTEHGVRTIIENWSNAKANLIETLRKHPNWNENKLMITLSHDYERKLDSEKINEVRRKLDNYRYNIRVTNPEYIKERDMHWEDKVEKLNYIIECLTKINYNGCCIEQVDGYTRIDLPQLNYDLFEAKRKLNNFYGIQVYTKESMNIYYAIGDFLDLLYEISNMNEENYSNIITEDMANKINHITKLRNLKTEAIVGQKIMKCFRKILIELGVDKSEIWNDIVAKLGDGLNPLHYTRHTILSLNPIDNLRSSMGSSWSSCHTIDRNNVDDRDGDSYEGMHAKGNLSYMLDNVTAVFYTVHNTYNGTDFELQDKVNRMLVHIGDVENPFFIQGRVYPQSNDYEGQTLYKEYRAIVQSILAECWEVPNSWQTPISSSENSNYYTSEGSHYHDYSCFDMCKISRLAGHDNFKRITIGHQELCVECGRPHYGNDNELSCCHPFDDIYICEHCGCSIDVDDVINIDGYFYCRGCSFYCEYHEEWECREHGYIENYGDVCDNALDSGDFCSCERCGEWRYYDDIIVTEDDSYFCCEDCANEYEYYQTYDGYWYKEDELCTCSECGKTWLMEDMIKAEDEEFFCNIRCATDSGYVEEDGELRLA